MHTPATAGFWKLRRSPYSPLEWKSACNHNTHHKTECIKSGHKF